MNKIRVGIVGSAFNPPHLGHKDILTQINREFDEILLVPSYKHAFGKQMIEFEDRLNMASALAAIFTEENRNTQCTPIIVSDIERVIGEAKEGPVYTFDLLNVLEKQYVAHGKSAELTFVLGPDNASFDTWRKFYRAEEIRRRWSLRSVSERLKVHSTEIRRLISEYSRPEKLFLARFNTYLDEPIASYIFNNNLYSEQI